MLEVVKISRKSKDIITMGFALFAIFFGAGNLIFPPYLGVVSGSNYLKAMGGFLLTDPVLPVLGVIVTASLGGRAEDLGKRVSPNFSKILSAIAILAIGPFFAVPRTAATTHDIAVSQIFPSLPLWVTSTLFFVVTIIFCLNESNVVSYIGNLLTPSLLIVLALIIIKCIIHPIGPVKVIADENFFLRGFTEGYQTMDALGAALMAGIVKTDVLRRGYKDPKEQLNIMVKVGIVCFILLAFVYGGLTYIGATASGMYTADTERVTVLLGTVASLFGEIGKIVIGIGVSLACLTTSVGLTATCGNFFESVSNGKLKYKYVVLASAGVSVILSLLGVEGLISLAVPILLTIYPVIIVLIIMSIFDKQIKYSETYVGGVVGAFIPSLIQSLNMSFNILEGPANFVTSLPLKSYGFEWLIPVIISTSLFTIYGMVKNKKTIAN
ncbi:branched-chain amino acid transport system II carrier protein [uncultured Peptoniphilus sp.]|uniref:branched-chain amino acid transport system II carrier protein n=1 Tax=uncultured Peptoniphilus sp. TaxID=254354 RepID=UPI002805569F|nr:branched-chain amino acid transport system II carrier protein [uncultured Peptoniphilus sp.]